MLKYTAEYNQKNPYSGKLQDKWQMVELERFHLLT